MTPPGPAGVIDCHCHAGEGDGLTGPWDTRAPDALLISHLGSFADANNGRRNLIGIVVGYVEDARANCGVRITKDVLREVKERM